MSCRIRDCDRPVKNMSRQLCNRHYLRLLRHGDPEGGQPTLRNAAPPELCRVDGCSAPHDALGFCAAHYKRLQRHGDPETQVMFIGDPEGSFGARHEVIASGCWVWTGALTGTGYGAINVGGTVVLAHRYALERQLGRPLREGHHAHHMCHEPRCVNPEHLEEIEAGEHARYHNAIRWHGSGPGQQELGV